MLFIENVTLSVPVVFASKDNVHGRQTDEQICTAKLIIYWIYWNIYSDYYFFSGIKKIFLSMSRYQYRISPAVKVAVHLSRDAHLFWSKGRSICKYIWLWLLLLFLNIINLWHYAIMINFSMKMIRTCWLKRVILSRPVRPSRNLCRSRGDEP